jgi:hypothetical protein
MKSNRVFVFSLMLNALLLAWVAWVWTAPRQPMPQNADATETSAASDNRTPSRKAVLKTRTRSDSALPRQLQWRDVESPDYKAYIANLRAIQCPDQTIRDIITARINKRTASQRAAIRRGGEEFVYWKPDVEYTDYYPKLRQERALEWDKGALLKELFGFDPNEQARRDAGTYEYMEWQYDFLTGDKREKAREIQERYVDQGRELKSAGSSDPEVQRKVRELYDKRLVELATVLSPEEVEEYDLCSSSLSESMRSSLDGFHPTPDEFRKLYRIKKNLKSDGDGGSRSEDDAAIREVLGEQRFAQYRRVQDYSYRELYRFSQARDLPADTADKVWELKTLTENALNDLRRDARLSPEERTALIRQNAEQAEEALVKILGNKKNLATYARWGGSWIQRLNR